MDYKFRIKMNGLKYNQKQRKSEKSSSEYDSTEIL